MWLVICLYSIPRSTLENGALCLSRLDDFKLVSAIGPTWRLELGVICTLSQSPPYSFSSLSFVLKTSVILCHAWRVCSQSHWLGNCGSHSGVSATLVSLLQLLQCSKKPRGVSALGATRWLSSLPMLHSSSSLYLSYVRCLLEGKDHFRGNFSGPSRTPS